MNIREAAIGGLMMAAMLAASETRAGSLVTEGLADPVVAAPCNGSWASTPGLDWLFGAETWCWQPGPPPKDRPTRTPKAPPTPCYLTGADRCEPDSKRGPGKYRIWKDARNGAENEK